MKKPLSLSRGPQLDTEKCVENAGGNRFNLVIMAAARARELARRHRLSESPEHFNAPISALLEFQEGKLDKEFLKRIK
jgi:DNA-directed RNA polymerase subunit K/omega